MQKFPHHTARIQSGLLIKMDVLILKLVFLTIPAAFADLYGLPYPCEYANIECSTDNTTSAVTQRLMAGGNAGRCFCDGQCVEYKDCCSPSPNSVSSTHKKDPQKCVALPYTPDNSPIGIYVKTTCIDGSKCPFSSNDRLASLPAFSPSSNHSYLNVFCAMCNAENYRDLEFGKVDIQCDLEVDEKLIKNKVLLYFNTETDEGKSETGEVIRKMCTPSYTLPYGQPVTKCLLVNDTCPNETLSTDVELCQSYLRPLRQNTILYRNRYCAQCAGVNFESLDDTDCTSPMLSVLSPAVSHDVLSAKDIFSKGFSGYSMTILLDLDLDNGNVVGTRRKCADGQVFDPWQNLCRPVICPDGQSYRDGSCRQLKPSRASNTPSSIVLIGATPLTNSSQRSEEQMNNLHQDHITHSSKHDYDILSSHNETSVSQALVITCPRIDLFPGEYTISGNFLYVNPSQQKFNLSEVIIDGDIVSVCLTDGYTNGQYVNINSEAKIILSVICYASSLLCLLVHFTVYILAGKIKMVPDLTLLSISASIFFGQLLLLLSPVIQQHFLVNSPLCKASAVLLHYSILCIFTWSSVIAYDITKSVSSLEHNSFTHTEYSSFWRYSLFAWLAPAMVVVAGLTMDQLIPSNAFSPAYGQHICWISRRRSLWVLLGAELACVIVANFILYCLTASALWRSHRRRLTLAVSSHVHATPPKEQFRLYVKLAMIMGLAWIIGFFSIEVPAFGYVYIVANGLQGVYIFAAFSCKRSVFQAVMKQRPFRTRSKRFSSAGSKRSELSHISSLSTERSSKSSLQVNYISSRQKTVDFRSP